MKRSVTKKSRYEAPKGLSKRIKVYTLRKKNYFEVEGLLAELKQ